MLIESSTNETVEFLKSLSTEGRQIFLNNLDEKVKSAIRSKDYILFSDI